MASMWTLWLITFGSVIGQGGASPVLTPLATYTSEAECKGAVTQVWNGLTEMYGKKNTPNPGVFICVPGALAKR
jgi:hypothetical protein